MSIIGWEVECGLGVVVDFDRHFITVHFLRVFYHWSTREWALHAISQLMRPWKTSLLCATNSVSMRPKQSQPRLPVRDHHLDD